MASLSAAGESMTSGSFHRVECRPYKLAKCDSCGGSVMLWRDFCADPCRHKRLHKADRGVASA